MANHPGRPTDDEVDAFHEDRAELLRCKQCGGVAEEARRCYATPVCFKCLPPPPPLPVAKLRRSTDA